MDDYFKKQSLLSPVFLRVCSITLLSNCGYSIIAPFMPVVLDQRGVNQVLSGLIFAIYSLAFVVVSPFMGEVIQFFGNVKTICLGLALMGTSFLVYGLIQAIEINLFWYVSFSLISRIF